jgi:hypothetical protein
VGGVLSTAQVHASSSIGALSVAAVSSSDIFAGVVPGLTLLPASLNDWTDSTAAIKSFVVRGRGTYSNTLLAAGTIGNASLGAVQGANGSTAFGVAAQRIRSLRAMIAGRSKSMRDPSATTTLAGDAVVRIV